MSVDEAAIVAPALVEQMGEDAVLLKGLNAKQSRFVEEYLIDLDAPKAARRAGYSAKGAPVEGYRLLKNVKIVDAITSVMAKRSERTTVNRSWVLAQLVDAHLVSKNGASAAHLTSRLKALELIGRHVDVRAFRAGLGFGGGEEGDGQDIWDLSQLSDNPVPNDWSGLSEFEVFERLLAKVTIFKPHEGGEGGAPATA